MVQRYKGNCSFEDGSSLGPGAYLNTYNRKRRSHVRHTELPITERRWPLHKTSAKWRLEDLEGLFDERLQKIRGIAELR